MSDVLGVRANRKGKLVLSIGTDGVRVDTTWTDCVNPVMGMLYYAVSKAH
jgi:hypothetical protein